MFFVPQTAHGATAYHINTVAGDGSYGYSGDGGAATSAALMHVKAMAVDSNGSLYVADANANVVRKIDGNGVITTVAGTGSGGTSGDGGAATSANVDYPEGIAVDSSGNLYISTSDRIRRVTPAGVISTIAGDGNCGSSGDGGQASAARLCGPRGLAFDTSGNLYVAVEWTYTIRRIAPNGVISTVAGTPDSSGSSGDGGAATSALLNRPRDIAFDPSGSMYITDWGNHRVRKVTAGGTISTFAGTGASGYSGDGGAATSATISNPQGIAVDLSGNVYFSSDSTHVVRRVRASDGVISTFAGTGSSGFAGDNGPVGNARLNEPFGIVITNLNVLYLSDAANRRVRSVWLGDHKTVTVSVGVDPHMTMQILNKATTCNGQDVSGFIDNSSLGATSLSLGRLVPGEQAGSAQRIVVSTNAAHGFTASVRGTFSSENLRSAVHNIADVPGTYASPAAFGATEAFGYTFADSTAGSTVTPFGSGNFAALDDVDRVVMAAPPGTTGAESCVGFQARASLSTRVATYSATVIYTVVPSF